MVPQSYLHLFYFSDQFEMRVKLGHDYFLILSVSSGELDLSKGANLVMAILCLADDDRRPAISFSEKLDNLEDGVTPVEHGAHRYLCLFDQGSP